MALAKNPVVDGKKFCKQCKETKDASEFRTIKQKGFEYLDAKCIQCSKKYHAKYAKKWYAEHPHIHRDYSRKWKAKNKERHDFLMWRSHIRRKYNLTPEEYNRLIGEDPKCGICGVPMTETGRRFDVDHNHQTGKVRGVLCRYCNLALERIDNIPNWIEKAKCYLASRHVEA